MKKKYIITGIIILVIIIALGLVFLRPNTSTTLETKEDIDRKSVV